MCLRNMCVVSIAALFLLFIFRFSYAGILPEFGTVQDYETGKQVGDAYVIAQWTGSFGIAHATTACYQTSFTITGKSGRYLQFDAKLPGPIGPLERNPHIFVYKRGYYQPLYGNKYYNDVDRDDLVRFSGSPAERLEYLDKLTRNLSCYGHDGELLPVYKLIYEEMLELADSEEEIRTALDMCLDIARYEVTPGVERQDNRRDLKIAKYLMKNHPECLRGKDFVEVIKHDDMKLMRKLLEKGFSTRGQESEIDRLYWEIFAVEDLDRTTKLELVKLVTDNGGNPFKAHSSGKSPVQYAMLRDISGRPRPEMAELAIAMIKHGAKTPYFVTMSDVEKFQGVENVRDLPVLDAFYDAGLYPDYTGDDGRTLLMHLRGNDWVPYLVGKGANVNLQDKDGRTAVHHASMRSNKYTMECAEALVKNGADVNITDRHDRTALFYAVSNSHVGVLDLLLRNGADASLQDESGKTVLWYARVMHDSPFGIIKRLERAGQ